MPTKTHDIVAVTGSYTDNYGKQKNVYKNVGSLMKHENGGMYIMLDAFFNPAGVPRKEGYSSIFLSLYPVKDKQQSGYNNQSNGYNQNSGYVDVSAMSNGQQDNDNIPF